jgi:hypothetical protein
MSDTSFASAEEAFQKWRSSRASRAEPIPESLWSMALGLHPEYKRSHICAALRISGAQFKRRLGDGDSIGASRGFVLASRHENKSLLPASRNIQLTLQGEIRSMTLCFDSRSLADVLPLVSALL